MKELYERLTDPIRTLPGFAWVVIVVTLAWTRMAGIEELSSFGAFILSIICWVVFRFGAIVDEVYDCFYDPQRPNVFRWKGQKLKDARDNAAKAILKVTDYNDAGARSLVYPERKLYDLAKTLAKNTEQWEKKISRLNDHSKMARTFFVFCSAFTILLLFAKLSPEIEVLVRGFRPQRLWLFGTIWAQALLAMTSLVAFLWLRVEHNIELYTYVKKHVVQVCTDKGKVPYVFEEILSVEPRHDLSEDKSKSN